MAIEKRCAKKNTLKGNSNALREYKKTITLNAIQKEVLVGTLLGDASIPLDRGKPALRVEFEQNIAKADYVQHLYDLFEDFVGTPPRVESGGGARDRKFLRFQTYRHPEFKFYYDLFYPAHYKFDPEGEGWSRKKRIPKNLNELLTPRALAYWFMDDGTYQSKNQRRYRYYTFSTHSFPLEDQEILVQTLRDNFEISANIQKHYSYYLLYIRSSSTERFVNLIRPYIHPCFNYKIQ